MDVFLHCRGCEFYAQTLKCTISLHNEIVECDVFHLFSIRFFSEEARVFWYSVRMSVMVKEP